MKVNVSTLGGKSIVLQVSDKDTLDHFKSQISLETSVPTAGMRLIHTGKVMEAGTLGTCEIKDGDCVILFISQKLKRLEEKQQKEERSKTQQQQPTTSTSNPNSVPEIMSDEHEEENDEGSEAEDEDNDDNNDEQEGNEFEESPSASESQPNNTSSGGAGAGRGRGEGLLRMLGDLARQAAAANTTLPPGRGGDDDDDNDRIVVPPPPPRAIQPNSPNIERDMAQMMEAVRLRDQTQALHQQQHQQQQQQVDNVISNGPLPAIPEVDPMVLSQLTEMGFSEVRCRNALIIHGGNPQVAMEFLLDRGDDESLDNPITPEVYARILRSRRGGFRGGASAGRGGGRGGMIPNFSSSPSQQIQLPPPGPERDTMISRLEQLGFSEDMAANALRMVLEDREQHQQQQSQQSQQQQQQQQQQQPQQAAVFGVGGAVDLSHPVVRAIISNPEIQASLRNPRISAAIHRLIENREMADELVEDPEVAAILERIQNIVSRM